MKKAVAMIMVLCLTFALFACNGSDTTDSPPVTGETQSPASEGSAQSTSGTNEAQSPDAASDNGSLPIPSKIGFFDREFDYSVYPKYKVAFLSVSLDALTLEWDKAFAEWASRLNIEYNNIWAPSSMSADEFLSGVQTFCDQGYDGLLLLPETSYYTRVKELCDENEILFFPTLGAARDYTGDGRLIAPSCGYDHYNNGVAMADKLIEWKNANFADVEWSDVGFISITWSLAEEIQIRTDAEEERWVELFPEFGEFDERMTVNPTNFFIADTASGTSDQVNAQNLVTQIISSNTDIKVWLIASALDFYAIGAANAATNLNMDDNVCVVSVGGTTLREQFDSGIENSWRYAYSSAPSLYTETSICGLWAYMAGVTTPETIFPEWIDPNDKGDKFDSSGKLLEEHNYAKMLLRSEWIDINNYQDYHEWSDLYQFGEGADGFYSYEPVTDINMFKPIDDPPAYYKK